ncbi:MAG TPA: pseudouridine synthase [Burkholderiales bacterium]|nr:pseudouridine synthase [Burkholderiales bacterium]
MPGVVLLNKPYGVVCQFSPSPGKPTLKDYVPIRDVYPAGRLDADSEGLLLLTDDGALQHAISHPAARWIKRYWVQVENIPDAAALDRLRRGLDLGDFVTAPSEVSLIPEPAGLWPRIPPIRVRRHIPTCWLDIGIAEGKNRQVRRMTAAAGHPTLRLIRHRIGNCPLGDLQPGTYRLLSAQETAALASGMQL